MSGLAGARLRSAPDYRLVPPAALPPREREAFGNSLADPDCHALLCPRRGAADLGVKAVSRDVARLLEQLAIPGTLPAAMAAALGDRADEVLAELILDGILAIEAGGEFVSGPAALPVVSDDCARSQPSGILARRSIDALRYGERLPITDSRTLSAKLYSFGRVPISHRREREFARWRATVLDLGPDGGRRVTGPRVRGWMLSSPDPTDGWLSWRRMPPAGAMPSAGVVHKLYVSPATEAVADAFSTVSRVLRDSDAMQVKVGADVAGVCRPDKIVIHFWDSRSLMEVSGKLAQALHGCPPHGVPFSAEFAGEGLLSIGIDPPPDPHAPRWLTLQSWRSWVTNRLGVALLAARAANTGVAPSQFALARLRLEGVDTQTWAPSNARFASEARA